MDWIQNKSGFTFLEMLLVLTVLMITLPFIPFLLQQMHYKINNEHISVQQFFVFIQNDARKANEVLADKNRLTFIINDDEIASIEPYQQSIRRRVNGKGHEIYLNDVASFNIEHVKHGYHVTVETSKGAFYEKTIIPY